MLWTRSSTALALMPVALAFALVGCDPGAAPLDNGQLADGGMTDAMPPGDGEPPGDPGDAEVSQEPINPLLNSIFPNRGPADGGTPLRIVGRDFVEGMVVFIGLVECVDLELESENHLRCVSPPAAEPAVFDVIVRWPDGERAVLTEGFTYFQPVIIDALDPDRGPSLGGGTVVIRGRGFVEGTEVRLGGVRAPLVELAENGTRIEVELPPAEPGTGDVSVRNLNGIATLPDAFTWYEDLFVDDVAPAWGTVDGGDEVRLAGIGLVVESEVLFDGAPATVLTSELERQSLRVTTPPGAPGVADLAVRNVNGEWSGAGRFLYVDSVDGDFRVDAVAPDRLPASGGTPFLVGGNGFEEGVVVTLDGERVGCTIERPQLLRCTPAGREPGAVDVVIEQGIERVELPGAIRFFDDIDIFDIAPDRGNMAGGTLVEVVGTGLRPTMRLSFDGNRAEIIEVDPEGNRALIRTPPGRRGRVSVRAETLDAAVLLPQAFEYFDPTIGVGGISGDELANAVNVSVLDSRTSVPIPGARVIVVGLGPRDRWEGVTDAEGRVTIADPTLTLPVSITAAAVNYSTSTYDRVTAENATLLLNNLMPPPPSPGDPPPEILPVSLSGMVRGIDLLEKPDEEGFELIAVVETSHRSPGNRLGSPPPLPNGLLLEDGPFEIIARPGEVAVVVTAGYVMTTVREAYEREELGFWSFRDSIQPIAMGLQRYITAAPGDVIRDLEVVVDRPMRMTVAVALDNPPGGVRGAPDRFTVKPVLALGAEGYFDFRYNAGSDTPRMRVSALPDLTTWPDPDVSMLWEGEAVQSDPTLPYNYSFAEVEVRDMRDGVLIGPMVGTTAVTDPVDGGLLSPFRWVEFQVHPGVDQVNGPSEPADLHLVRVTYNGQIIWTHVLPGAVSRFRFPTIPVDPAGQAAGVDLVEGEPMQMSILSVIVGGEFDFADFTFNDFGRLVSYSWSYIQFQQ